MQLQRATMAHPDRVPSPRELAPHVLLQLSSARVAPTHKPAVLPVPVLHESIPAALDGLENVN
jgi:hypothetical protein